MPEQLTVTRELILTNPHRNSGIFSSPAHVIRCCLCMPPAIHREHGANTRYDYAHMKHHILRIGSEAIRLTFRNGAVAYYALTCWNDPKNADRVKRILAQERKPKIDLAKPIS